MKLEQSFTAATGHLDLDSLKNRWFNRPQWPDCKCIVTSGVGSALPYSGLYGSSSSPYASKSDKTQNTGEQSGTPQQA